jgi:hypothetical protein
MIKFRFDNLDVFQQIENPLLCALCFTCLILLLTFLWFDDIEMYDLFYYGIIVFVLEFILLFYHYKSIKQRFSKDIINISEEQIISKALV